MVARAVAAAAL